MPFSFDLALLDAFVLVAETKSFSLAAKKLRVQRSSVSRSIAALEDELSVQLFTRTTRHVALTAAGATFLARVRPPLASLQEAIGALPEREELPSGELRITVPTDLGATLMPGVLAGFLARYPSVRVELRITNERLDLVAEGIDLALRAAPGRRGDSTLVAKKIAESEVALYASATYLAAHGTPRKPDDVASDHAWLAFRGHAPPPPIPRPTKPARVSADDMLFMREALLADLGIGMLPTQLARPHVVAGQLVRVLPKVSFGAGALWLVHPPAQHLPKKTTAFRDFLVEYLAAHPPV